MAVYQAKGGDWPNVGLRLNTEECDHLARGLDPEALRFDAERHHSIYGDYGLSVFAARDVAVDDLEAGIADLRRCEHRRWMNPYHEH